MWIYKKTPRVYTIYDANYPIAILSLIKNILIRSQMTYINLVIDGNLFGTNQNLTNNVLQGLRVFAVIRFLSDFFQL